MAGLSNPLIIPPLSLLTDHTLAINGESGSSTATNAFPVGCNVNELYAFVKNTGTSTNVTVTIKGADSENKDMVSDLAVFTLGAGSAEVPYKVGKYIEKFPDYIFAEAVNSDATAGHTAILTVKLSRRR